MAEQSYVGFCALGRPRVAADIRQRIDKDFGSVNAARGLVLHPVENLSPSPQLAAILKYNLAGKYTSLEMTALCRAQRTNPLLIELLGDGKTLTPSEDLTKHQPIGLPISADVRGIRELTILVTAKTTKDFGYVLLIDPRLRAEMQSAARQPLLNGKDLAGWRQLNPHIDDGQAETLVVEGQPILKLTPKVGRSTRDFDNYHLRFEYKAVKGSGGGWKRIRRSSGARCLPRAMRMKALG